MTTNEMIYKTITTKLAKEPIYKSILEDLGYEVYDSGWSYYDNWTVRNKETKKQILISKHNYTNRKALFNGALHIRANDLKKVNYVDLLSKNKPNVTRPEYANYIYNNFVTSKYSELRHNISNIKSDVNYLNYRINFAKGDIDNAIKRIEKLNKDIEQYYLEIEDKQKRLGEIRKRVAELKERRK